MSWLAAHNAEIRGRFPALSRQHHGQPIAFFDGPAGTQVPQSVIDAIGGYLREHNANHGGVFATSVESDAMLAEAHAALADFVDAADPEEIVFGPNMTSLTFALSRSVGRSWRPGDEIVVTRLDHDANVTPWVMAAQDAGATVRHVGFRRDDWTLDMDDLREALSERTRLVAVGCASNATGGVNPIAEIASLAHEHGALVFADAVHFAPHRLIDVSAWEVDFLACSAYKFFGPHLGILWGRRRLLELLPAYKVRPAPDALPGKWMTGTQNHEGIAGALACVEYMADLGREIASDPAAGRRDALRSFYDAVREYEDELAGRFLSSAAEIERLNVYGITDLSRLAERCPTFAITLDGARSRDLARRLAEAGIYVWHGNYYAVDFHADLGLEPDGTVRLGLVHYNNGAEIDRAIDLLRRAE
jgi:cysteine desulfurase family protein (TIGR01976 family)